MSQATQQTESPAERDHSLWLEITNDKASEVVQQLLEHAVAAGASDLFLLAEADHVAVMARHLSVLRPISRLPAELGKRCQAHIKGLADMDIAEKRRPLDGRWKHRRSDGSIVDLRINTVPTLYGEDFTLRILVRDQHLLDVAQLGMLRRDLNVLLKLLSSPSGLILVTPRDAPSHLQREPLRSAWYARVRQWLNADSGDDRGHRSDARAFGDDSYGTGIPSQE